MYILGINSAYHESSACITKDGRLIAAAEEERFNRVKHGKPSKIDNSNELPLSAIEFCLQQAGRQEGKQVRLCDVAHIGYSLDPKERLEKNSSHKHPYPLPPNDFGTPEGEKLFYRKNIEAEQKLRRSGFKGSFHYLRHHDCHAASSFFVSPYEESAVLVIDGIGEFESTTPYRGKDNRLERISQIDFPNSLGFLWEKITKFMGFSGYDAYKVMGLAPYGDSRVYKEAFGRLVKIGTAGTFTIDDSIIRFRNEDYSGLERLFNLEKGKGQITSIDESTRRYADVAAALQERTGDIIVMLARSLKERAGSAHLCMAGGVALNCVANARLLQEKMFDGVFIQPSANDAGTAVGATYYIWNQLLDGPRGYRFENIYLGPGFSEDRIREVLDRRGLKYARYGNIGQMVAKLVAGGSVVGWFQGQMEFGPRALGNRSILADPRKKEMIGRLNCKVKHRELFRPFGPSVLEESICNWFETGGIETGPARYMLVTYGALPHRKGDIPAVVHVDGTSRIQSVSEGLNPKYYGLIQAFEELTGVPMVLNTSFNDKEPIVCSPEDAVRNLLEADIDYLAIGDFLVPKAGNVPVEGMQDLPLKEFFERLR